MKEIEEEYASHVVPKELSKRIKNPYILVLNIESIIKELENDEKTIYRKKRRNHIAQKVMFNSSNLLKEEEKYYNGFLELIRDNIYMIISITDVLTDETFPELIKLMDFIVKKYEENKSYYLSKIEGLDLAKSGIGYLDNRQNYSHPAVKEFLENKINSLNSTKKLEKK